MAKKIVILNGSPRRAGNTSALVQAFAAGARRGGAEVTEFFLGAMQIHPCRGCWGGGRDPAHPCVQRDDMEQIYPAYRAADVVVLASPEYYWSVSGLLKTAFDRLFAVAECDANYANPVKESVLLMAAEGHEFEEAEYWYDRLMGHLGWTSLGKVLAGGVLEAGAIRGRRELADAEALGEAAAKK